MAIVGEQELKEGVIKLRSVASREEVSELVRRLRKRFCSAIRSVSIEDLDRWL